VFHLRLPSSQANNVFIDTYNPGLLRGQTTKDMFLESRAPSVPLALGPCIPQDPLPTKKCEKIKAQTGFGGRRILDVCQGIKKKLCFFSPSTLRRSAEIVHF
jgi:hypothetical protein